MLASWFSLDHKNTIDIPFPSTIPGRVNMPEHLMTNWHPGGMCRWPCLSPLSFDNNNGISCLQKSIWLTIALKNIPSPFRRISRTDSSAFLTASESCLRRASRISIVTGSLPRADDLSGRCRLLISHSKRDKGAGNGYSSSPHARSDSSRAFLISGAARWYPGNTGNRINRL